MLMWVENRFINKGVQPIQSAKDRPQAFPPFNAPADPGLLADAQAMVLRDRNHPSVVIWSLSVHCAAAPAPHAQAFHATPAPHPHARLHSTPAGATRAGAKLATPWAPASARSLKT